MKFYITADFVALRQCRSAAAVAVAAAKRAEINTNSDI